MPGTLSRALALAFQDDPVFEWIVPDTSRRRARLPAVFATFTDIDLPHDESGQIVLPGGPPLWSMWRDPAAHDPR